MTKTKRIARGTCKLQRRVSDEGSSVARKEKTVKGERKGCRDAGREGGREGGRQAGSGNGVRHVGSRGAVSGVRTYAMRVLLHLPLHVDLSILEMRREGWREEMRRR